MAASGRRRRHRPRPDAARLLAGLRGVPGRGPRAALGRHARSRAVPPWYAEPALVTLLADRVDDALVQSAGRRPEGRYPVIFTAHSLPERVRETGDTYPEQLAGVGPPGGRGGRARPLAGGLAERGPHPRALARPRRPRRGARSWPPTARTTRRASWSARSASWPTTSRCSTTSTSSWPRVAAEVGLSLRAHGVAQRRPTLHRRAGRRHRRRPGRVGTWPCDGSWSSGVASAAWPRPGSSPAARRPPGAPMHRRWSSSKPRPDSAGRCDSGQFGGRVVDIGPGRIPRAPARSTSTSVREVGLGDALGADRRSRRRRSGPAASSARCPRASRSGIPDPLLADGPLGHPRARVATLGLARDALLPRPDVRGPIGDRSIGPLVTRKLGQRVTRRAGRPADRRHPRRLGRRHVGRRHLPAAARRRADAGQPDARAAGRGARARRPTARRSSGPLDGGMASLVEHAARCARRAWRGDPLVPHRSIASSGVGDAAGPSGAARADASRRTPSCWPSPAPAACALLRPHDDEAAGLLAPSTTPRSTLVDLPGRRRDVPAPLVRHRVPGPAPEPGATGRRALGGDRLHVSLDRSGRTWRPRARCSSGPRSAASTTTRAAGVERRGGRRAGLGRARAADRASPAIRSSPSWRAGPAPSRSTGCTILLRTAGIEAAMARLGGIAVAGAAYRGVGIPACIASGRAAARAVS